jgi:predicted NUDIX family NTP pyrophosphohydrolase
VHSGSAPPRRGKVSAGLLMYRLRDGQIEVFVARPGGPWFPRGDFDLWTIPKGEVEPGEDLLNAAVREFREEVGLQPSPPYIPLGSIRQRGGKTVHAWAFAGDWSPGSELRSARMEIEWPPGSGHRGVWPELERAALMGLEDAKERLKLAQHPLLDRLVEALKTGR